MSKKQSYLALVSGGTGGIGERIAWALAKEGFAVVFTGRNEGRGVSLERRFAEAGFSGTYLRADLSSQKGTAEFAENFTKSYPGGLDVLVNNVGAVFSERKESPEGAELTVAVNFLHPLLLSALLFPLLKRRSGLVVNISTAYHLLVRLGPKDLRLERWDSGMNVYGRAKLMFYLYGRRLASRWNAEGVQMHFADPGMTKTALTDAMGASYFPVYGRFLVPFIRQLQARLNPRNCVRSTLRLVRLAGFHGGVRRLTKVRAPRYLLPLGLRLPSFLSPAKKRDLVNLEKGLRRWLLPELAEKTGALILDPDKENTP